MARDLLVESARAWSGCRNAGIVKTHPASPGASVRNALLRTRTRPRWSSEIGREQADEKAEMPSRVRTRSAMS